MRKILIILSIILITALASYSDGKVRLGINKIKVNDVNPEMGLDITMKFYNKLRELKGEDTIIFKEKDRITKSVNRQFYGNIDKFGSGYVLTIKVSDGSTGNLFFSVTKIIKKNDNLNSLISKIANEIADKQKIWSVAN